MADNVVEILVKSKNSTRAGFRAAEAEAEASATRIGQIFEKMNKNVGRHLGGIGAGLGGAAGILGAGSGLLAMAGPIGAAGVALGAFGAIAIPILDKVAKAHTALTAAQLQYNKATTAAGRATALRAEAAATAGLTSQQKGLMGAVSGLQRSWGQLENQLTPVVVTVAKMAISLASTLMPVIRQLAPVGAAVLRDFLGPLTSFFKMTTTIIPPGWKPGEQLIHALTPFGQFIKALSSFAQQAGPLISQFLIKLITILMQLFVQTMPAGLKILKLLLPALLQMLTQMVPIIVVAANVVAVILKWLAANKLLVPALWLLTGAFVAMKLALLSNPIFLIGAAIAVLAFLVVKYHKEIWAFITRIWGDIFGFLKRTWTDIVAFARKWWPLLLGPGGLIVVYHQQMFGFIQRIWNDIVGWFRTLPGRITGALSSLGSGLYNLARAAMTRLWHGARSLWDTVISFFKNLGHSIISGILHILNPFSDTGPFFRIGAASMDDLLKGLRSRAGHVLSWMQHMASGVLHHLLPGGGGGIGAIGSGVQRWAGLVSQALGMLGEPQMLMGRVLYQMQTESDGNPRAINLTDINAQLGHPSMGLMQVIDSTFQKYAGPLLQRGVWDPLANIYAAINYAMHVYGSSLMNSRGQGIGSGHGYWAGTSSASPGWAWVGERGPELVRFRGGEQVVPAGRGGIQLVISLDKSVEQGLGADLLRRLRFTVRTQGGGSVQAAFGS